MTQNQPPIDEEKHDDISPESQANSSAADPVLEDATFYKEKWLRAQADYHNLQKQTSEDRVKWITMSEAQVLEKFLPVFENFKKAFAYESGTLDAKTENWKKGIEYIKQQFGQILSECDVQEMKTVGLLFDPASHEALSEEESEEPAGTILKELSGGYTCHGKVLIPAKVVVTKKKDE